MLKSDCAKNNKKQCCNKISTKKNNYKEVKGLKSAKLRPVKNPRNIQRKFSVLKLSTKLRNKSIEKTCKDKAKTKHKKYDSMKKKKESRKKFIAVF